MKIIKLPLPEHKTTPAAFSQKIAMLGIASLLVGTLAGSIWPWNEKASVLIEGNAAATTISPPATNFYLSEQSDFLSGQTTLPSTTAVRFIHQQNWQAYATRFTQRWQALYRARWEAVSRWAATELPSDKQVVGTLFYPFGGPDALYASLLFPRASEYLLVGLEPIGELPHPKAWTEKESAQYLQEMEDSLRSLLNLGFFITNQMQGDFHSKRLNGVLPVLLALLARTEHQLTKLEIIGADAAGNWSFREYSANTPQNAAASLHDAIGIKVHFQKKAGGPPQALSYLRLNLDNTKLSGNRAFRSLLESRQPLTTLIKSASYLLHTPKFSTLRELILRHSTTIVQDDSGLPLKHFAAAQWQLRFYGVYKGPISLFAWAFQTDLEQQFSLPGNARPLPFGIGYRWQAGTANLLIARKAVSASQSFVTSSPKSTPTAQHTRPRAGGAHEEAVDSLLQQIVSQGKGVIVTPLARQ